jgi:hypothetical protein
MNNPTAKLLNQLLDRETYQVIWQHRDGSICIDGDREFAHMTREAAIEAYQSCKVLKVFCINLIEASVRDVTDEVADEAMATAEAA